MDQTARRIEFLRSKLEELAARRQRLTIILSDGSLSGKARELWAKRLDWVIEDIGKRTTALAELEKESAKTQKGNQPPPEFGSPSSVRFS
jgi:hypothetical protein